MDNQLTLAGEVARKTEHRPFPHSSTICIDINTNFKRIDGDRLTGDIDDNEDDWTEEITQRFHTAVHTVLEHYLTEDGEEFAQSVLDELEADDGVPSGVKEFNDFGEIRISIYQKEGDE